MNPSISYRHLRPGDTSRLAELTRLAIPRDAVDEAWLTENILLDVNFDPRGLIIASRGEDVLGFVYAVRSGHGTEADPDGSWITIGCVHPEARRQGIGTELLNRALAYLHEAGARHVNYSGYPPAYFLPGLDTQAYPAAAALLEHAGFTRQYTAAAMAADLATYATPSDVHDLEQRRLGEGYRIGPAQPEDLPGLITFARTSLAPDWGSAVRDSVLRHGHLQRTWVVCTGDEVVGFATYGAYRGLVERFGPFGVHERLRGTGLGRILLHRTMTAMRAEGAHTAWFLWTGENSPAGHLYRSAGFEVTRRFDVLRRDEHEYTQRLLAAAPNPRSRLVS